MVCAYMSAFSASIASVAVILSRMIRALRASRIDSSFDVVSSAPPLQADRHAMSYSRISVPVFA